jgi:ubiquitin-conjugating enzyme E2 Z
MTNFVSKETIHRLLKDIKNIITNPLIENGIYYIHDDADMLKGYALIIGPEDTPYFGGNYFFEINYPIDYPYSPPKVKYCTNGNNIRFNPNLYKCGKVCISLLNTWKGEQWTSCQTISTILLTLCTLLCKDPLLNEPGVDKNNGDFINYTNIIEYANIDVAICDIINKKKEVYLLFFDLFSFIIKENFLKNHDKLLLFLEKKMDENKYKKNITTVFYLLNAHIDYKGLIEKFKKLEK